MKLKEIVSKTAGHYIPESTETLNGNVLICSLDHNVLNQLPETVYITDEQGEVLGKIERGLLFYLAEQQKHGDYEKILNHMSDAVIAVDAKGRIYYANPAYTAVLGVPLRRIIGKWIQEIEPESLLSQALTDHAPKSSEKQLVSSVGKYVSLKVYPLWEQGCFSGAVSIFRDVTQVHKLGKEVQQMSGIVSEYSRQIYNQSVVKDLGMITCDRQYRAIVEQAVAVARTDVPMLIRGENGTGKDVLIHFLHRCSNRKDRPLIIVNCAAIPESLMESELFGYEGGAFTGAERGGRKGKFELADGGTIFLDEIGDMPLLMQSKLLRVLQQGEIEKIGRQKKIPIDVRILAATNQPLEQMIVEKKFRQDLFFRINTMMLTIPPLRQRIDDIIPLTNQFLEEYNAKYQKQVSFSSETYKKIQKYAWPGNIRELKSYVERAVILSDTGWKSADHSLSGGMEKEELFSSKSECFGTLAEQVRNFERRTILTELEFTKGNRTLAMEHLGLSRRTFYRKCAELEIGTKNSR